jgi:hypothetical protein
VEVPSELIEACGARTGAKAQAIGNDDECVQAGRIAWFIAEFNSMVNETDAPFSFLAIVNKSDRALARTSRSRTTALSRHSTEWPVLNVSAVRRHCEN